MIGNVYKIITNQSNECYIGSTTNELRYRFRDHKTHYEQWKRGDIKKTSCSYDLFEQYGLENCKIMLIKKYEVSDRKHLLAYEQLWINKLNPINKRSIINIPRFTQKFKYKQEIQKNPNYNKDHYERYLKNNPEQRKKKYEKNKEKMLEKRKERIECECGLKIQRGDIAKHKKTKNHIYKVGLVKS